MLTRGRIARQIITTAVVSLHSIATKTTTPTITTKAIPSHWNSSPVLRHRLHQATPQLLVHHKTAAISPTNMSSRPTATPSTEESPSPQQQETDFISLASDSESDIEIDLYSQPSPKKTQISPPKVPKHFRKSNAKIYDNISVYAPPDSNLIFRCSQKRADWYLSRNLAHVLSPTSIHLNFEPAGQGRVNDPYYLEERENKCVICGQETSEVGATMLHVVPEQYRKWFPLKMKSHASHDIVVACPECNANWDREAAIVRKQIVSLYKVPLEGVGWVKDYEAGAAKRAAGAIVADWNRRWNEHRNMESGSSGSQKQVDPVVSSTEQGSSYNGKEKKTKGKKQAAIPFERILELETTVMDWWSSLHGNSEEGGDNSTGLVARKRESGEPDDPEVSRKKQRQESEVPEGSPLGKDDSTGSSTKARSHVSDKSPMPVVDVPFPPPGVSTALSRRMLQEALAAAALYKSADYKEHGQLVVARVMASSPQFHDDKDESQETLRAWREAQPLMPAMDGWTDVAAFVRSWRKAFLEKTRPQHLSNEWRVENPAQ